MANILLIDDNAGMLKMQVAFLQQAGHAVTTAVNGKEGLKLVAQQPFDLVITDLVMPEKEGIEVIIELRQKLPALKIIAISGGGRVKPEGYLVLAQKLGAAKTLAKPFSGKELVEAVTSVLASDPSS
jgi:DNA-binding response OmpR family regulator